MQRHSNTGFFFALLQAAAAAAASSSSSPLVAAGWDPLPTWGGACGAFRVVVNQSACDSCTAAALAASVGMRACMRDRRDAQYSGQQVWDCSGLPASACGGGVVMQGLVASLTQGAAAGAVLLPTNDTGAMTTAAPNVSACYAHAAAAAGLDTASTHSVYWGGSADGRAAAQAQMMAEIVANGPVVVEILLSATDFARFSAWWRPAAAAAGDDVFNTTAGPSEATPFAHSLVVYGWTPGGGAWRVQNSYGARWGSGGRALLDAALVSGAQWFAFTAAPQACAPPLCGGGATGPAAAAQQIDLAVVVVLAVVAGCILLYLVFVPCAIVSCLCCWAGGSSSGGVCGGRRGGGAPPRPPQPSRYYDSSTAGTPARPYF